jgi:hypothetical protein
VRRSDVEGACGVVEVAVVHEGVVKGVGGNAVGGNENAIHAGDEGKLDDGGDVWTGRGV